MAPSYLLAALPLLLLLLAGLLAGAEARQVQRPRHRHRHRHERWPALDYEDYAEEDEDESAEWAARPLRRPPRRQAHRTRAQGHRAAPGHRRRYEAEDEYGYEEDLEGFDFLPTRHKRRRGSGRRHRPELDDYEEDYGYEADEEEPSEERTRRRTERRRPPVRRDDEEEDPWREEPDPADELDNDFYRAENPMADSALLRPYDDLIRKLTGERSPPTPAPTVPASRSRESRDALGTHLERDAYGNLRLAGASANASSRPRAANLVDGNLRKSLEVEDDEEAAGTQADGITDYVDEEEEKSSAAFSPATTTSTTPRPTTSTTTMTTTSTTTTTSQRPYVEQRNYESPYNHGKGDYPPMSPHSALKWQYLGTRESVKETRNSMQQFGKNGRTAEVNAAYNHVMRVAKEGRCQWPRARVIPVRDVYPNLTATYMPHCAILHRCSDDTGCCRSEALTCEAKQTQRVELYFYATYIHGKTEIEKLTFENHTECECRERKEFGGNTGERLLEQRSARHYTSSTAPQNIVRPPARKPCRCPTQFTSKITFEGVCECSCLEHDQDCLKLQRGKGYLSLRDRICIQNDQCTSPNCTFGEFITAQGRCPKKKDIFEAAANHRPSHNFQHHRRF